MAGLAALAGGDERFALDSYRLLIQVFGKTVCEVPGDAMSLAMLASNLVVWIMPPRIGVPAAARSAARQHWASKPTTVCSSRMVPCRVGVR